MTESDVLMEWFEAIAARSYQVNKAFLSRPVLAARFLYALHTLRFPPPGVRGFDAVEVGIATHHATTAYYADAYYGWRFEFDGDHDKAFFQDYHFRGGREGARQDCDETGRTRGYHC